MSPRQQRFPRISAFLPNVQASPPQSPKRRAGAFLGYGFRPFFLGAAIWAIVLLWLGEAHGHPAWHAHEALFGFGGAVVAGFLLTAVPNWTGRLPVAGGPLALLFALWCAGRAAFLFPDASGPLAAAALDGAFLPLLAVRMACDVIAARNWRNLKTMALLGVFAAAGVDFHLRILGDQVPDQAIRLGIAALVGLVMLIGGRMAPGFTRDWLARRKASRFPAAFDRLDVAALAVAGAALALWVMRPHEAGTGLALVLASALQALRLSRWRGLATWREPLLLVLHVGYAFLPLGFLLAGLSVLVPHAISTAAASHAWTTGAVGVMSLGVMTRAARGHGARPLTASALTTASYAAATAATVLRIGAGGMPGSQGPLLLCAGIAWTAAFGLYLIEYAPMLVSGRAGRHRVPGRSPPP